MKTIVTQAQTTGTDGNTRTDIQTEHTNIWTEGHTDVWMDGPTLFKRRDEAYDNINNVRSTATELF